VVKTRTVYKNSQLWLEIVGELAKQGYTARKIARMRPQANTLFKEHTKLKRMHKKLLGLKNGKRFNYQGSNGVYSDLCKTSVRECFKRRGLNYTEEMALIKKYECRHDVAANLYKYYMPRRTNYGEGLFKNAFYS
jgi:hypothetical protein